jgi:hypothetical protein
MPMGASQPKRAPAAAARTSKNHVRPVVAAPLTEVTWPIARISPVMPLMSHGCSTRIPVFEGVNGQTQVARCVTACVYAIRCLEFRPRRQVHVQQRAQGDGITAQPRYQPAAPGRPFQRRRRQPPRRPRLPAHAQATPDRMNDFVGPLIATASVILKTISSGAAATMTDKDLLPTLPTRLATGPSRSAISVTGATVPVLSHRYPS